MAETAGQKSTSEPSKEELQRQIEQTRESVAETVDEIKETVSQQYESARETVVGVLDYRKQFGEEPLVWSLGALSAGFALGYTMGYAHKNTKGKKKSEVAAFADSLISEFSVVGKTLVMPQLNARIKTLFGFDFSDLLDEIGSATPKSRKPATKRLQGKTSKAVRKKSAVKVSRNRRRTRKEH